MPQLGGMPPFQGGAVGYLAYEMAHHLESLPRRAVDDLCIPEMAMGLYDWVIARDHATGETWAVSTGLPERGEVKARRRLRWIQQTLREESPTPNRAAARSAQQGLSSGFTRDGYLKAVEAIKHYIASGDVYQVAEVVRNLALRDAAKGLSAGEKSLYTKALSVLVSELAFALNTPEEKALAKVTGALT